MSLSLGQSHILGGEALRCQGGLLRSQTSSKQALAGKQPLPSHLCRAFKEAEMVARTARAA